MNQYSVATFANGCFWCTEAVFQRLRGVIEVQSGYIGGVRPNPSYEQVSTGATGHAEALQITFDPAIISFETLLEVFWATHNPTTLNRQGYDVGTQYRSAIFYHDDEQRTLAEKSKAAFDESGEYTDPVVTEIVPFTVFYPAEGMHENYFNSHQDAPYCQIIIAPKIEKLMQKFPDKVEL